MPARPSLDLRLFFWWDNLPPGRGVTMDDMLEAMGAGDAQTIRISLTRIRQGKVKDPSRRNGFLRPVPIRYNAADRRYYNLEKVTPDLVAQQVPAQVLTSVVSQILNRVLTLDSAIGHGLVLSAQNFLSDDDLRQLLAQLPLEGAWRVHETTLRIAQARQLLALAEARNGGQLPPRTLGNNN